MRLAARFGIANIYIARLSGEPSWKALSGRINRPLYQKTTNPIREPHCRVPGHLKPVALQGQKLQDN